MIGNLNDNNRFEEIVKYLQPEDLINLKQASKHYKGVVEKFHPQEFLTEDKLLHRIHSLSRQIHKIDASKKNINAHLKAIEESKLTHESELNSSKSTFTGFIADIARRIQLIEKLLSIFPLFTKEINQQKKLTTSIENENKLMLHLESHSNKKDREINKLKNSTDKLESRHSQLLEFNRKKEEIQNVIYDLFDGEENFLKIPLLDLSSMEERITNKNTGYIDYIKAEDMPFSVMRGEDKFRRPFFALKNDGNQVQVFFQRYALENDWSDAGFGVIPSFGGYWIEDGKIQSKVTDDLKAFIKQNRIQDR